MGTTVCILLIVGILAIGVLLTGWHIIGAILHLVLSLVRVLFHWPILLAILVALIAFWVFFLR